MRAWIGAGLAAIAAAAAACGHGAARGADRAREHADGRGGARTAAAHGPGGEAHGGTAADATADAAAGAGGAAPASALAIPAGCHAAGDGATIFPPVDEDAPQLLSYRDPRGVHTGAFELCDLPDRVVVVDSTATATADPTITRLTGAVIVTPRGRGATTRWPIAAGSQCLDRCNGPAGGAAGCSMDAGCEVTSAAPGAHVIRLSLDSRDAGDGTTQLGCGPDHRDWIGLCATRERLVLMDAPTCRPGMRGPTPFRLRLAIWERGAPRADGAEPAPPSFELRGDLWPPDTRNGVWAYRFADDGAGLGDVVLRFTVGAAPSAALTVGGETSDCLAFGFVPRAR